MNPKETYTLVRYYLGNPKKRHEFVDSFTPLFRKGTSLFQSITDGNGTINHFDEFKADEEHGISQEVVDFEMQNYVVFLMDHHQRCEVSVGDPMIWVLVHPNYTLIGNTETMQKGGRLPRADEIHPAQLEGYRAYGLVNE